MSSLRIASLVFYPKLSCCLIKISTRKFFKSNYKEGTCINEKILEEFGIETKVRQQEWFGVEPCMRQQDAYLTILGFC